MDLYTFLAGSCEKQFGCHLIFAVKFQWNFNLCSVLELNGTAPDGSAVAKAAGDGSPPAGGFIDTNVAMRTDGCSGRSGSWSCKGSYQSGFKEHFRWRKITVEVSTKWLWEDGGRRAIMSHWYPSISEKMINVKKHKFKQKSINQDISHICICTYIQIYNINIIVDTLCSGETLSRSLPLHCFYWEWVST